MSSTRFPVGALVVLLVSATMLTSVHGQTDWTTPRTPWGAPDLQGLWNYNTLTPLERPRQLEGRASLTDEEVAAALQAASKRAVDGGQLQDYNAFWSEANAITHIAADKPTSLIVDPPDGKLPPLTPAAQAREAAWRAAWQIRRPLVLFETNPARGPEDFGLSTRCLVSYSAGPPIVPGANNSHLQIFQTSDQVVLFTEMIHDVRVVPLGGRRRLPPSLPQWHGDSRGWWEGDTLIVESTNFTSKRFSFSIGIINAVGSGETLHLTERFTRLDADTLQYEYTVDDPVTFTRPFTVVQTMEAADGPPFEYACHEGNYAMSNALSGARAQERDAERAASGAGR